MFVASDIGRRRTVHTTRILQLSYDLPVVVEIADRPVRIGELSEKLRPMAERKLVTWEQVTIQAPASPPATVDIDCGVPRLSWTDRRLVLDSCRSPPRGLMYRLAEEPVDLSGSAVSAPELVPGPPSAWRARHTQTPASGPSGGCGTWYRILGRS